MNNMEYVKEVGGASMISYIRALVFHKNKTPHQVGHSVWAVLKARDNWEAPPVFIRAVEAVAEDQLAMERELS